MTISSGIAQLSQLIYHKHDLDDLRQVPDIFQTFTAFDIQKVLWKYVVDSGETRLEAIPQTDLLPTAVIGRQG